MSETGYFPNEIIKNRSLWRRMIWIETPTNPNLKVVDIQAVADIAHSHENVFVVVDNTFESAYFQR